MKPHQQRVVDEKIALDDRIEALANFINSSAIFQVLDDNERLLLTRQLSAMQLYSRILQLRIINFQG